MSDADVGFQDKLDDVTTTYAEVTVAFLRKPKQTPEHVDAVEAFGSGFLLEQKSKMFLVTACHVVEEALKSDVILRTSHGSLILSNIPFAVDHDADIAVASIGPKLQENGIVTTLSIPTLPPEDPYVSTPIALFMGHPSATNKLDGRSSKRELQLLSVSAEQRIIAAKVQSATSLKHPLYFDFHRDKIIPGMNVSSQSRMAPQPFGMSGGPVLRIFVSPEDRSLQASLIGIAVEWDRNNALLLAADCTDMWPLLDHMISA